MDFQAPVPGPEWPQDGLADQPDPWLQAVDDDSFGDHLEWGDPGYVPDPESDFESFDGEFDNEFADTPTDLFSTPDELPAHERFRSMVAQLVFTADQLAQLASEPDLSMATRDELMDATRKIEQASNTLQVPSQSLTNLMESTGCRIDGPLGLFASPQAYLSTLVGIRISTARDRVRAAQLLSPTITAGGEWLEPRYPVLAKAEATGQISPDRIQLLTKALQDWEKLLDLPGHNVTRETLAAAEGQLAEQAVVFGGAQLERIIERIGDYLDPDGVVDDRQAQDAVRSLEVKPIARGMHKGMYRLEGRLTAEAGAKALAVLDPLSKPQPIVDESGHVLELDRRDRGMRMHDALDEVMDRSLRAGDLPAHGGTPATMIITAEAGDVFAGTGIGTTETGDRLPMASVYALADEAEVVRTVFHKETGEVLYLGRSRRLASYPQTLALAARDGGCSFPGCSKSPKWCQRHHIVDWIKGGDTDLPNLTLLCPFHHYRFARHGWSAEYRAGRVWWRPPKIIDPERKPILNLKHRGAPLIT